MGSHLYEIFFLEDCDDNRDALKEMLLRWVYSESEDLIERLQSRYHITLSTKEAPLIVPDEDAKEGMEKTNLNLRPDFIMRIDKYILLLIENELYLSRIAQMEQALRYYSTLMEIYSHSPRLLHERKYLSLPLLVRMLILTLSISPSFKQDLLPYSYSGPFLFFDVSTNWIDLPKAMTTYKAFSFIQRYSSSPKEGIYELRSILSTLQKPTQKLYFRALLNEFGGFHMADVINDNSIKHEFPSEEEAVKELDGKWVRYLTAEQLRHLAPEQLRYLTPEQLRHLTPEQLRYLTPEQLRHLTPDQLLNVIKLKIEEGEMSLEDLKKVNNS